MCGEICVVRSRLGVSTTGQRLSRKDPIKLAGQNAETPSNSHHNTTASCSTIAMTCLLPNEEISISPHRLWPLVKPVVSLLVAVISLFPSPEVLGQEQTPDQPDRYHLIQLVDPTTFLEKVNDTARRGYRLIAVTAAPGQSLAAIMERVEKPSARYSYISIPVRGTKSKYETAGKTKAEVSAQLNVAGAKGYRLCMTFGAEAPNLTMLESNSEPGQHYEYALTSPGVFGYFKTAEISGFLAAGYHWAGSVTTFLIFERAVESSSPPAGSKERLQAAPYHQFTFPENNFVRSNLPEKQLYKLAAQGARVVDFFGSPLQMILAMEETVPPSAPYQYIVLNTRNQASPLALHAKRSKVEATDLTRVGKQGFRLLRLSAPPPPFVMEKGPGSTVHFEYQFIIASRLSNVAEQLNSPSMSAFHVAKMVGSDEGFLVILERSDAE